MTVGARRPALLVLIVAMGSLGCRRSRLPPRGDGEAVVVLPPSAAESDPGAIAAPESEPNDTRAQATVISLTGDPLSAAATATLAPGGKDIDLFKVAIPGAVAGDAGALAAGRKLSVDFTPTADGATSVQLQDAAGHALVVSTAVGRLQHGIPNATVLPGGIYYVRVSGGSQAAIAYRLQIRVVDFERGDEREPNDQASTASLLFPADTNPEAAGFFGWRKDEDWFRLPLASGAGPVALEIELDGVEGVTPTLTVVDSAGQKIASARGRKAERLILHDVLPTSGAHAISAGTGSATPERVCFVVVRADSGRNADQRYLLHIRNVAVRDDVEREPNDDLAHATPVTGPLLSGYLGPGDTDVFAVQSAAEQELQVQAEPPEHVSLRLELLDADGKRIAVADEKKRGGIERSVTLRPSTAKVYLRLSAAKGDGNLDEPYHLRVFPSPRQAPDAQ